VWELLRGCIVSIERATRPGARPNQRTLIPPDAAPAPVGLRSIPAERPAPQVVRRRAWGRALFGNQPPPAEAPVVRPAPPLPPSVEVIVVDNGSQDGTVQKLQSHFPWVQVLANEQNLGFTRANNQGFARSSGRTVYFLNPDTELEHDRFHGDSLFALYDVLQRSEGVAMVGPQLRNADNSLQSSARRFPEPLTGFFESTWLGRALPLSPWTRRLHMADWPVRWGYDVDWIVGAAMLCRREALVQVMQATETGAPWPWQGPFDERFFMYSEETDLCLRLKLAGWRVLYVPQARVIHFEGRSSEQAVAARHIHFNRSKVFYWRKWFGPRWSESLRRYILLEYRVQVWVERAKWLVGSKRDLRRQRIGVYRHILRTRLRDSG
jgi:GT2 family glycosyltransferase